MTLYEELAHNLGNLKEYYRVQGGHSRSNLSFSADTFEIQRDTYLYISRSMKHHTYFLDKRIRQTVDDIVFDSNPTLTRNLSQIPSDLAFAIDHLKHTSTNISLESLRLKFMPFFRELVEQNCIRSEEKTSGNNSIETTDRSQGIAYGFSSEWLELFDKVIILIIKRKLTDKDIIDYLKILKMNAYQKDPKLLPLSLINSGPYNYAINRELSNDFARYDIINLLETIVEKGLVRETSDLAKRPTETIKNAVNEYQKEKVKVLRMLESIAKKNLDLE